MTEQHEGLRRLRATYAEFRSAVAAQRAACAAGDAEAVLAAALDGDWVLARLAELHADVAALGAVEHPLVLVERAACAAEAEALAKELDALAMEVGAARDRSVQELADLTAAPAVTGYQAPSPILLDTRG